MASDRIKEERDKLLLLIRKIGDVVNHNKFCRCTWDDDIHCLDKYKYSYPCDTVSEMIEDYTEVDRLCSAAKFGKTKTVKNLLRYVDTDSVGLNGWTPLQHASSKGHVDIMELLLEDGAKLDYNKNLPLELAATKGKLDAVRLLISKGVDITEAALIDACRLGHTEIVKLFLESGASIPPRKLLSDIILSTWPTNKRSLIKIFKDEMSKRGINWGKNR